MRGAALWAIIAGLVIAPNVAIPGFAFPYDQQRIVQVLACALAIACAIADPTSRARVSDALAEMKPWLRLAIGALLTVGLCSALTGPHPREAILAVSHSVLVLLSVLAAGAAFRGMTAESATVAGMVLAISLGWTALDVGLRVAALESAGTSLVRTSELFVRFQHTRFFGHWLTWALPLLTGLRLSARPALARAALTAVSIAGWGLAIIAAGRGTLVAQPAATATVLLCFGRAGAPWARAHGQAALGGLVAYLAAGLALPHAWDEIVRGASRLASISDSGRFVLWREAIAMTSNAPWIGASPRSFAWRVDLPAAHPHNAILQLSSEWGIAAAALATFAAATILGGWLLRARREIATDDPRRRALRCAVAAALVGAALHSMLCGILITPVSQLMLVLTGAWAIALDVGPRRDSQPALRGSRDRRFVALALLAALGWLFTAAPELARVRAAGIPPDIHDVHLRPRIWHDETSMLRAQGATQPARRPTRQR